MNANPPPSSSLTPADEEVIRGLKQAILTGKLALSGVEGNWYLALLEAVRQWQTPEEVVNGQPYRYLIAGEAFDFLQLAQRLLEAVGDLVPEDEKVAFLFRSKPPVELATDEFKKLIGEARYSQYLNYFYGITAEEALIEAVEAEARKEDTAINLRSDQEHTDEAYLRIYGATQRQLLRQFRRQKGYPRVGHIGLDQMKEFTYWLFKYRLEHSDKARIASDTKKALAWLKKNAPGVRY